MRIVTEYWPVPIAQRDFDWTAIDEETYDGSENSPVGYGRTERAAIRDLKEKFE